TRADTEGHHTGLPLGLFAPILREVVDACAQHGPEAVEQVLGPEAAVLAPLLPFIARIPWVATLAPPAPLEAERARTRLFCALTRVLERVLGHEPALVVLDDIQWADELSLGALEYLSAELGAWPWRVVGTCRSEEMPAALRDLAERHTLLNVPRLDRDEAELIVAQMLGQSPDADLVDMIAERSGGNAFFIAEYLRLAVDEGLLLLNAQGSWTLPDRDTSLDDLPEPTTILELVTERLAHLTAPQHQICHAAAVVGRSVPRSLLVTLLDLTESQLGSSLRILQRRCILDIEQGTDRVRFVHDKLREVIYGALSPEARRPLHARVAEELVHRATEEIPVDWGGVGWHWAQAERPTQARAAYLKAARQAVEGYALADARRHYEAGLALFAPLDPEAIAWRLELLERAMPLSALAAITETVQEVHRTLDLHPNPQARARIQLVLAQSHIHLDRPTDAHPHIDQGLAFAQKAADRTLQARAYAQRGSALVATRTRLDDAAVALNAALQLSAEPNHRGVCLRTLGSMHYYRGDMESAYDHFTRAVAIFEQLGDRAQLASAKLNLGNVENRHGHSAPALQHYQEALDALDGLGMHLEQARILNNMGNVYIDFGQPAQAIASYRQAQAHYARLNDRVRTWRPVVGNLALAQATLGHLREAHVNAQQAAQLGRDHPEQFGLSSGLKILAWVSLVRGDLDTACASIEEVLSFERARHNTFFRADALACYGHILRVRGDLEAADRRLSEAIALFTQLNHDKYALGTTSELGRLRIAQSRADEALTLLNTALAGTTLAEDVRADAFVYRAMAHRLLGNLVAAENDLQEAHDLYTRSGYRLGHVLWCSEQGLLALEQGLDPSIWWTKADFTFRDQEHLPDGEAAQALERLRDALAEARQVSRAMYKGGVES
ncbi:MAG: tetratricopeptide repeat protein, partial [Myxococcota bacterium]